MFLVLGTTEPSSFDSKSTQIIQNATVKLTTIRGKLCGRIFLFPSATLE